MVGQKAGILQREGVEYQLYLWRACANKYYKLPLNLGPSTWGNYRRFMRTQTCWERIWGNVLGALSMPLAAQWRLIGGTVVIAGLAAQTTCRFAICVPIT